LIPRAFFSCGFWLDRSLWLVRVEVFQEEASKGQKEKGGKS